MIFTSCHFTNHQRSRSQQRGLGLAFAIFLITIMSVITITLAELAAANLKAYAQEVVSSRTLQAANSGAQIALTRIFPSAGRSSSCIPSPGLAQCDCLELPEFNPILNFTEIGLNGCSVQIQCTPNEVSGESYFDVRAIANCNNADVLSSSRIVETRATL